MKNIFALLMAASSFGVSAGLNHNHKHFVKHVEVKKAENKNVAKPTEVKKDVAKPAEAKKEEPKKDAPKVEEKAQIPGANDAGKTPIVQPVPAQVPAVSVSAASIPEVSVSDKK